MLGYLKSIYNRFPKKILAPFFKTFGLIPVFSKKHWKEVWELKELLEEGFSKKKVDSNLEDIGKQIDRVSYYKNDIYNNFKAKPNLKNLTSLPLIDSEILRNQFDSFINLKVSGYYTSTGGSGRNPLKLYLSNRSYFRDRQHTFYAWSNLGYKKGDLKLTLRGVNLGLKLVEYNPMNHELNVNVFLLNESNIEAIVNKINSFKPVFGHGYPSAWYNFASLIEKANINLDKQLKGIFFASESIDYSKKIYVEQIFNTNIKATYAFSERACFAYQTIESGDSYNLSLTYGLVEIIKDNGDSADIGERGEIVCTGFINEAMPLLRYRTGDYATVDKIREGFVTMISNVKGRWGKDYILDDENNQIFTTSINIHSDCQYDFRYIQLHHTKKGQLTVKMVPFGNLNENSFDRVLEEFQNKLPTIAVIGEIVNMEDLYKSKRMKIPYLVKS